MNKITTMAAAVLAAVFISSCGNRANAPENETDLSVAHKYTNPTPGEFPILGWFSIRGSENQTRERYLEMAECGFNLSLPYVDSLSEVRLALDASRGTGVRIIAKCAELDSLPEQTVGELMSHPSLAGYFFKDEPHMELYGQLADRVRRVRAVDDSKMLYLNLFPTYAGPVLLGTDSYNEYISRFIKDVGTGMVSYDHYSITADTLGHTALNPRNRIGRVAPRRCSILGIRTVNCALQLPCRHSRTSEAADVQQSCIRRAGCGIFHLLAVSRPRGVAGCPNHKRRSTRYIVVHRA